MTSFDDVVRARWHALAEPDDPKGRVRYDAIVHDDLVMCLRYHRLLGRPTR